MVSFLSEVFIVALLAELVICRSSISPFKMMEIYFHL